MARTRTMQPPAQPPIWPLPPVPALACLSGQVTQVDISGGPAASATTAAASLAATLALQDTLSGAALLATSLKLSIPPTPPSTPLQAPLVISRSATIFSQTSTLNSDEHDISDTTLATDVALKALLSTMFAPTELSNQIEDNALEEVEVKRERDLGVPLDKAFRMCFISPRTYQMPNKINYQFFKHLTTSSTMKSIYQKQPPTDGP